MTKTHAELLPCPFCNAEAYLQEVIIKCGIHEPEKQYEVGCSNFACITNKSQVFEDKERGVVAWNARANKEADFLEELKCHLNMRIVQCDDMKRKDIARDRRIVYVDILEQIEQFQAEQKVSDDNINI